MSAQVRGTTIEASLSNRHLRSLGDAHRSVAGDPLSAQADVMRKAKAVATAGGFHARWLPKLIAGKGQVPTSFSEFGPLAAHLRFVERASRRPARSTFYVMSGWQGRLEYKQRVSGPDRGHRRGVVRHQRRLRARPT